MLTKVLVLNADFIPLHLFPLSTITWQEAIILVYQEKATPLEYQGDHVARSPTTEMRIPSVVVLKSYKFFKKHAKLNKSNIKLRDEYVCQYCEKKHSAKSLTIDHVLPKSHGGDWVWENLVAACKHCNSKKENNRRIIPLKKPRRPTYYELARKLFKHESITNEHWGAYINFKDLR